MVKMFELYALAGGKDTKTCRCSLAPSASTSVITSATAPYEPLGFYFNFFILNTTTTLYKNYDGKENKF